MEGCAIGKGVVSNGRKAMRELDVLEGCAIFEEAAVDCGNALGDCDGLKGCAVLKGIFSNGNGSHGTFVYAFVFVFVFSMFIGYSGYIHRLQGGTTQKGRIFNAGYMTTIFEMDRS